MAEKYAPVSEDWTKEQFKIPHVNLGYQKDVVRFHVDFKPSVRFLFYPHASF